ncbi:MAG: hypothetical protein Kow00105_16740 [Phycisphaeraceae bacterium]
MMIRCNNRRAFTLIELVVVISIIALLMGLLMPALSAAKRSARDVKCKSNMRQFGIAGGAFMADHRDQMPSNRIKTADNQHITWRAWFARHDYLPASPRLSDISNTVGKLDHAGGLGAETLGGGDSGWDCPNAPSPALRELQDGPSTCSDDVASHYAYNGELAWRSYPLNDNPADVDLLHIQRPSQTIIILETRSYWPDLRINSVLGRGRFPGAEDKNTGTGYFSYWHAHASGNWTMYDGSVQNMRLLETLDPDCYWLEQPAEPGTYADHKYLVAAVYR